MENNATNYTQEELSYLFNGNLKLTPSQIRTMKVNMMADKDFNNEDQYCMVTPSVGPQAVKILTARHAAEMIYDKGARLATADEKAKYDVQHKAAYDAAMKNQDRLDIAKAMERIRQ